MLKACQTKALAFFSGQAKTRKKLARENLEHVLEMSNINPDEFSRSVERMKAHVQVALHFHPDRSIADGRTVIESLLESGLYQSQFETGISAGSVSATPGGFRWEWEKELFGGAYNTPDVEPADRPKYGALNLMRTLDGPAPRFGSCYLLLRPEVGERCTFTYRDSHLDPPEKGTWEEFDDVLSALVVESFERNFALGLQAVKPRHLMERFFALELQGFGPVSRNLDHYIEAQVHGTINLKHHATHLVADSSFQRHEVGRQMEGLAKTYALELVWRPAFEMMANSVPSDFRGAVMPGFAARVACDGRVNAHSLGIAAARVVCDPGAWKEFGEPSHLLQLVKRLWHTIVKCGEVVE